MHPTTRSLATSLLAPLALLLAQTTVAAAAGDGVIETIEAVETRIGGRVGVAAYQDATGRSWEYRAEERFPLSSTFKAFACAALLARVDAGTEDLGRVVTITEGDLVSYSPVTETRLGPAGMTLSEVCEATVTLSDNTAGNIVLQSLDGPAGFTAYMRSIGDPTTRLDRWETELNEGKPGDPRDTTTPKAAAESLRKLLFGELLSPASRRQLTDWMLNDKVADALIRAAVPAGWRVADKTGAGGFGARSIIAVIWPPEGAPVIAAVYMTENTAAFAERNAAIVEIGAAIVKAVAK